MDWGQVFHAVTMDDKIDKFNSLLMQLYDRHAPIRAVKIKHFPAPWLTDNIKRLLEQKVAAKCKFKRRPTDLNREKYTTIRNHCNKVCRDAQRHHIHKSFENGDPSKVWKFLK